MKRSKRAPVPKERTDRDWKAATPQADRSNKIPAVVTKTVPPHIVAEMQMMNERMNFMMNAFKGRVLSDLDKIVHRTDSSFTALVTSFLLPLKFRIP